MFGAKYFQHKKCFRLRYSISVTVQNILDVIFKDGLQSPSQFHREVLNEPNMSPAADIHWKWKYHFLPTSHNGIEYLHLGT